jgi:hypothetical protein
LRSNKSLLLSQIFLGEAIANPLLAGAPPLTQDTIVPKGTGSHSHNSVTLMFSYQDSG